MPRSSFQGAPQPQVLASAPPNLLDRRDLIYGSEIGAWLPDGTPPVNPGTGIPAKVTNARIPVVRFALHDTFTDLLDPLGNPGQISRADYRNAIIGITQTMGAVPWLKMLPIAKDLIGTKTGDIWCPPWTGDASGNLPTYKAMLAETRKVYSGPIIIESNNEMEYACWATWKTQNDGINPGSAGAVNVSKRIGEHYAATMPQLKKYARDVLGFSQVVLGGYLGISGGTQWGATITVDGTKPYGYAIGVGAADGRRWVTEFNTAVHSAFVTAGSSDWDYVPDFLSMHAYPHGGDFSTATTGYEFTDLTGYDSARPDDIAFAFYRNWITVARGLVNGIWTENGPDGLPVGPKIRFSISEWEAGLSNSGATWSGWTTGGRPEQFYAGWLQMLRGDGAVTGSGTRYWNANAFLLASESDTGSSKYYNLVKQDGSTQSWYDTFRSFSGAGY